MSAAFGFVNVLPSLEALPSSLHHEADSQCVKHIRNTGLYPIQFKNSIITTKILNIHCHIKKQFCSTEVRFFGWNKIFYILQTCSDFRFAIYAMHPWRAIDLNCTSQNVKFRVSLFSIQPKISGERSETRRLEPAGGKWEDSLLLLIRRQGLV